MTHNKIELVTSQDKYNMVKEPIDVIFSSNYLEIVSGGNLGFGDSPS